MPAGSYAAGLGLAGVDPVAAVDPPRNVRPPVALWWDATTKQHLIDDDGRYLELHPIDQRMGLALTIVAGTVRSAPDLGAKFRALKYAGGPALRRTVEDMVSQATATITSAGDATILSTTIETPSRGAVVLAVAYVNNRTKKQRTVRAQL